MSKFRKIRVDARQMALYPVSYTTNSGYTMQQTALDIQYRDTDYARIERAIKFLEDNYRDHPSLDDIARHVHLSPFHFERLFKRWAGVTPKQFVHFLTLNHAKEMLKQSKSVLATAYDAGLSSGSRLHDLFVKIEATTPGEFKDGGAGLTLRYGFHRTPFGECFVAMTDRGICSMSFNDPEDRPRVLEELQTAWPNAILTPAPADVIPLIDQIMDDQPPETPIHLHVKGTNFQLQVWQALLKIPAGKFVSYEDLAHAMNRPSATRAVSSAVAKNPVGYLIPCHRVIRKSGVFGQYHWGTARKKALLAHECAREMQTYE